MNNCKDKTKHTCGDIVDGRCIELNNVHPSSELTCPDLESVTEELYDKTSTILNDIDTKNIKEKTCKKTVKRQLPLKQFYSRLIEMVDELYCEECPEYNCSDINISKWNIKIKCEDECEPTPFSKLSQLLQYLIDKVCQEFGCNSSIMVEFEELGGEFGDKQYFILDFNDLFSPIDTLPLSSSYGVRIEIIKDGNILELLTGGLYGSAVNSFNFQSNIYNADIIFNTQKSIFHHVPTDPTIENNPANIFAFDKLNWAIENNLFGESASDIFINIVLIDPETDKECSYLAKTTIIEKTAKYKEYNDFSYLKEIDDKILFYKWSDTPEVSKEITYLDVDGWGRILLEDSASSSLITSIELNGSIDNIMYAVNSNVNFNNLCNSLNSNQIKYTTKLGSSYQVATLLSNFTNQYPDATRSKVCKILKDPVRTTGGNPIYWLGFSTCQSNDNHYQLAMMFYGDLLLVDVAGTNGAGILSIGAFNYNVSFITSTQATATKIIADYIEAIFTDTGVRVRQVGNRLILSTTLGNMPTVTYANTSGNLDLVGADMLDLEQGWEIVNFGEKIFPRISAYPMRRRVEVATIGTPSPGDTFNIGITSKAPFATFPINYALTYPVAGGLTQMIQDFETTHGATIFTNHGVRVTALFTSLEFFTPSYINITLSQVSSTITATNVGRLPYDESSTANPAFRVVPEHIVNGNLYVNITNDGDTQGKTFNIFQQTTGSKTSFQDFSNPSNWSFMTLLAGSDAQSGTTDGVSTAARFGDTGQLVILSEDSTRITDMLMEDYRNSSIRRLTWNGSAYVVSTYSGQSGTPGYLDGALTDARFDRPRGMVKKGDFIYVHDVYNNFIRKINTISGTVETFSGTGEDLYAIPYKF